MRIRSVLLACAVLAVGSRGGAADDDETKPFAFFSPLATLDADKLPAVGLTRPATLGFRPNVEQFSYVFVYNPTKDEKTVNVVLSAGTKAGGELARTATPVTVPGERLVRVALAGKGTPAAPVAVVSTPAPADKAAPATDPPGQKLADRTLVLRVEPAEKAENDAAADAKKVVEKTVSLSVNPPQKPIFDPVEIKCPSPGTLFVTVRFNKPTDVPLFSDRPAKVRLDLRPDLKENAVLDPATLSQGTFEADLPVGGEATLFAEGVKYKGKADSKVKVAVSVDGYDRAFIIETNFDGRPTLYSGPFANVKLSSTAQVPGKPVRVTVEADNIITTDPTVLSVERVVKNTWDDLRTYPTPRRNDVYVKVGGENDAVQFTPVVTDWAIDYETKNIAGRRTFRVQRGTEKSGEETRELLIDRTAPIDTQLIDLPAKEKTITGTDLPLKAVGRDAESDVAEVYFYMGDAPGADGKPAPGSKVVRGVRVPKDDKAGIVEGTWRAKDPIRLPETRGEVRVGALFVNGVGMSTPVEDTLYVRDPEKKEAEKEKEKPKRTTGTIKGTVVWGGRLSQPDLPVVLSDAAGKEVKKTTTDSAGAFTFKDVPPGEYTVYSIKKADQNSDGSSPVTVEAVEKPATVEINVSRMNPKVKRPK
ncbi:SpaA isopeptide-forming pilin-related protein [Limnoglobus roseus]|uniref:Carboxypeptidase regulatory-like domain-containing protein n=1 Tax=Limnoglobus roseus TaxID=2598579 RepID=A0A5C1AAY9_9BACT|nr:SpaA isopeptide-forming pilin-related protein [Limnoglobus roseus]QEL14294.1 carboxypeptidase regulatory-like domain-containing protein [Limnoglobus roseus]